MLTIFEIEVTPLTVVIALLVMVVASFFVFGDGMDFAVISNASKGTMIDLHPDHVKYMKSKEEEFCSGNFGKGTFPLPLFSEGS